MAVQLQIMSDLQLKTPQAYDRFEIPPMASYLALLGDIDHSTSAGLANFLTHQLTKFEVVFFLLGNHEPYHGSWEEFIFLDQTRHNISDRVTVLGCTLYSNILDDQLEHVSLGLNDIYHIRDWDVKLHREAHQRDLKWLNEQVQDDDQCEPHRKIVVFSYHSQVVGGRATNPKHAQSPHTSGFATDLSAEDCWASPNVKLWAFGHMHFNCDYKDENTGKRVVTNQRVYYIAQSVGFDVEKIVMV